MRNPNAIAHSILVDVFLNGQYANLALKQGLRTLSDQDKNRITALVYTTLRHQLSARAQWIDLVDVKPKERIALILDMAVIRLFYLDRVPDYAVVDESVDLAKATHASSAGLINAILRKVVTRGKLPLILPDPIATKALAYSIPLWIYTLWVKQYGEETADAIAKALTQEAPLCARINTLKTDLKVILDDPEVIPGTLAPLAIRSSRALLKSDWFKEGKIVIQDESSQLVAHFTQVKPHQRVLDLCSAPGSKSTAMAAMMENTGSILACDVSETRLTLVNQQADRLGVTNLTTLCVDGRDIDRQGLDPFDVILVDAPCSGLGVLRHKPDIKVHLKPETLDDLVILQKQLLDSVSKLTKIEGILVYSTCTLNRKENELQIQGFLKTHPNYDLIEQRLILPQETDSDGFYMAKLKRVS